MNVAPLLTTERLTLRAHGASDLAASLALWNQPEVYRHISGKPCTEEAGWGRLQRYAGQWALGRPGFWVVEETSTGAYLGEMGFGHFRRALDPSPGDRLEAGWVLDPAHHGRGYAQEAMRAAFGWLARVQPPEPIMALIAPENALSLRLAARFGFVTVHETHYNGEAVLILDRAESDWNAGL